MVWGMAELRWSGVGVSEGDSLGVTPRDAQRSMGLQSAVCREGTPGRAAIGMTHKAYYMRYACMFFQRHFLLAGLLNRNLLLLEGCMISSQCMHLITYSFYYKMCPGKRNPKKNRFISHSNEVCCVQHLLRVMEHAPRSVKYKACGIRCAAGGGRGPRMMDEAQDSLRQSFTLKTCFRVWLL
jgi:hypothetical protein